MPAHSNAEHDSIPDLSVFDDEIVVEEADPTGSPDNSETPRKALTKDHSENSNAAAVGPLWLTPIVRRFKRKTSLLVACTASLLLGGGLGHLSGKSEKATHSSEVGTPAPVKIYVATSQRRSEPIQPLVPFADLNPAAIELGRRLFHEPALSGNGRIACASCHALHSGGTSRTALPTGANGQTTSTNPPTVFNVGINSLQNWEADAQTLEELVDDAITHANKLGSNWQRVIKFLNANASYRRDFQSAFGGEPSPETVRTALATFERSLVTLDSKMDQWLVGNEQALTNDEFGGYFLFKKFGCSSCHLGAGVGGKLAQPMGVLKPYFGKQVAEADLGRFQRTQESSDRHVFRVPQLRNVELTAPYLHDGSIASLEQAVAIMIEFQCGETVNQEDVRRITAFLKTLTGVLPDSAKSAEK